MGDDLKNTSKLDRIECFGDDSNEEKKESNDVFDKFTESLDNYAAAAEAVLNTYGISKKELYKKDSYRKLKIKKCIRNLLELIGEDPNREGLKDTPDRVARMFFELYSGYSNEKEKLDKLFKATFSSEGNDIVLVKDIPFYSNCEHHMVTFMGTISIAYIPNTKILGLSKFVRLVEIFARRLQIQERLGQDIIKALVDRLEPQGVMIIIKARHMCMESRGVNKPGVETTTSVVHGIFKTNVEARKEVLALL